MQTIKEILIERDHMTPDEADALIEDAKAALYDYTAEGDLGGAEEVCSEFFGLEPDFLMELMGDL